MNTQASSNESGPQTNIEEPASKAYWLSPNRNPDLDDYLDDRLKAVLRDGLTITYHASGESPSSPTYGGCFSPARPLFGQGRAVAVGPTQPDYSDLTVDTHIKMTYVMTAFPKLRLDEPQLELARSGGKVQLHFPINSVISRLSMAEAEEVAGSIPPGEICTVTTTEGTALPMYKVRSVGGGAFLSHTGVTFGSRNPV